jgi:hypothetical protein
MTSQGSDQNTLRFNLTASTRLFHFEIALHLVALLGMINLITWPDIVLFSLLFVLLMYRYFAQFSVLHQYDRATGLEIRPQSSQIVWHNADGTQDFSLDTAKIHMTRWFILLQLGKGSHRVERLLMEDSFPNVDQYCHCRRMLIELNLC